MYTGEKSDEVVVRAGQPVHQVGFKSPPALE
jgi:hypothetical protein